MKKINGNILLLIIAIMLLSLSGCVTSSSLKGHLLRHERLAIKSGFEEKYIIFDNFTLKTYERFQSPCEILRIYIEGDGNAWKRKTILSDDPTPSNPAALRLAMIDPHKNIAYIARPGQFPISDAPKCDPAYWSNKRFAPEVIEAVNKVIDMAKNDSGARSVEITGYSGGGAIAVLVAASRNDIVALRTIAGNLDIKAFCDYHHVSPLDGSLNPIDYAKKVRNMPQKHFIGSRDKVIPDFIAESFADKIGDPMHDSIYVVTGATHNSKWQEAWEKALLAPLYNGLPPGKGGEIGNSSVY